MEATNISIKQQSSVSINVETLQAIKQHLWLRVKGAWLRVKGAWLMVKGAWLMVKGAWLMVQGSMSLPRLYRKELRLARAVAWAIDAHPTISNIAIWLMGIGIMVEIFMLG